MKQEPKVVLFKFCLIYLEDETGGWDVAVGWWWSVFNISDRPIPTIKPDTLVTGMAPPGEAGAGGWEVKQIKQELT